VNKLDLIDLAHANGGVDDTIGWLIELRTTLNALIEELSTEDFVPPTTESVLRDMKVTDGA